MGSHRLTRWLSGVGVGLAACPAIAQADSPVGYSRVCPPVAQPRPVYPDCPPALPVYGYPMPGSPTPTPMPGTSGTPTPSTPDTMPANPMDVPTPPPIATPPVEQPVSQAPVDFSDFSSDSTLALGGGDVALTPNLIGDEPGMLMNNPFFVVTTPDGRTTTVDPQNPDGRIPTVPTPVVDPTTGQMVPTVVTTVPTAAIDPSTGQMQLVPAGTVVTAPTPTPTNPTPTPVAVPQPTASQVLVRLPQYYRGAFKITENESPRPRTRAYVSYYFYDQLFAALNPAGVPRMALHQEVFGYEQAFLDNQFSVGVRLPYSQLVSPGFFNQTALGDITVVAKGVISENPATSDLLSAGLAVTIPTGDVPFQRGLSSSRFHSTLLQPYLGYILNGSDAYFQGFSAAIIPTDDSEATVITNDFALGYYAYRRPGGVVSLISPAVELHVNTPLSNVGLTGEPTTYFHNVTVLGTTHIGLWDNTATVGFSCGAPITGPRPFSLQAGVQMNWFF